MMPRPMNPTERDIFSPARTTFIPTASRCRHFRMLHAPPRRRLMTRQRRLRMRALLTLGILAMLGCAASKPIPPYLLSGYERRREDFSKRVALQGDAPGPAPEGEMAGF